MANTPNFVFRLPVDQAAALREMSKIYGSPNTSAFLREMVGSLCSGNAEKVKEFNAKLMRGIGEQLTLKLNAATDEAMPAPASVAPKPAAKPLSSASKRGTKQTTKPKPKSP